MHVCLVDNSPPQPTEPSWQFSMLATPSCPSGQTSCHTCSELPHTHLYKMVQVHQDAQRMSTRLLWSRRHLQAHAAQQAQLNSASINRRRGDKRVGTAAHVTAHQNCSCCLAAQQARLDFCGPAQIRRWWECAYQTCAATSVANAARADAGFCAMGNASFTTCLRQRPSGCSSMPTRAGTGPAVAQ